MHKLHVDEGLVQPISVLIDQRGGIEAERNWACNAVMCKVQWRMGTTATATADAAAAEDIKDGQRIEAFAPQIYLAAILDMAYGENCH